MRHDPFLKDMFDSDKNKGEYEKQYLVECISKYPLIQIGSKNDLVMLRHVLRRTKLSLTASRTILQNDRRKLSTS